MTDFSARYIEPPTIEPEVATELASLRDDNELIESVTLNLYPSWERSPEGEPDPRLDDGRDTWFGIVDELTRARAN